MPRMVGGGRGETVLAVPAVTELGKEVQNVTTREEQQGALGIPDRQHRTSPSAARGKDFKPRFKVSGTDGGGQLDVKEGEQHD